MSSKQEEWSDDLEDVVVQTEFNQPARVMVRAKST